MGTPKPHQPAPDCCVWFRVESFRAQRRNSAFIVSHLPTTRDAPTRTIQFQVLNHSRSGGCGTFTMIETFERKIIRFRANRTLPNVLRDNQSLALQMISRRGQSSQRRKSMFTSSLGRNFFSTFSSLTSDTAKHFDVGSHDNVVSLHGDELITRTAIPEGD